MTPKEVIDRMDDVLYSPQIIDGYKLTLKNDGLWLEKARFALYKMIPQFVLCQKGRQGIRQTRYYCPVCKKPTRDHERFCHNCGQAVKYPKLVYSKTDYKNILDWSEAI